MTGTALTLEIGGSPIDVNSLSVEWTDDSKKIHSWKALLSNPAESVSTQSTAEIKKGGTSLFKGIVEQVKPIYGMQGTGKQVGGRHTKVKLWRKWNERFETKEGFWGAFYPHEIIRFFLNPSTSDFPEWTGTTKRVGWGLESTGWIASAIAYETSGDETYRPGSAINKLDGNGWWRGDEDGQSLNDWFKIDLGENKNICAIIMRNELIGSEHRNMFARNYKIEISPDNSNWYQVASKSTNKAMNIIHSWDHSALSTSPINYQNVRYVKITITSTVSSIDWRIGDVYLFEHTGAISGISEGTITTHDPLNLSLITDTTVSPGTDVVINIEDGTIFEGSNYCQLKDDSGEEIVQIKSDGVSGNAVTVKSISGTYTKADNVYLMNLSLLHGFNLKYDRLSNSIEKIVKLLKNDDGSSWEWEVTDNGAVNVGIRIGSDKSGTITFEYAVNIIQVQRELDDRQRVDRVLVLGGGKGVEQDRTASGWQGSGLYESIIIDQSLGSKQGSINKANEVLNEKDAPAIAVVKVYDDFGANSWGIGDDVEIDHTYASLSGSYKVRNINRTWSSNGEIVTITAEDNKREALDTFWDLRDQLWIDSTVEEEIPDTFDEVVSKEGYIYFYEAESLSLGSDVTIEDDDTGNSSGNKYIRIAHASSGLVMWGPSMNLVPGWYKVTFYCQCSTISNTNDLVKLAVYSDTHGGNIGVRTIQSTAFSQVNTWEPIEFNFYISSSSGQGYKDVGFRVYNKGISNGRLDIDWAGISVNAIVDYPPGAPDVSGVTVTATGTLVSIDIKWDEVTDKDLDHYILYRDTTTDPTTEYARIRTNSFSDINVTVGTTYYYRIKAVDWAGNESDYSSEDYADPQKVEGSQMLPDTVTADLLKQGIEPFESDVQFSPVEFRSSSTTSITVNDDGGGGNSTLTLSSGNWSDHGFATGDNIILGNSDVHTNDGYYTNVTVSGSVMTFTGTVLTDDSSDYMMVVVCRNAISYSSGTIEMASGRTRSITGNTVHGLSTGIQYLYFDISSSSLGLTSDYASTVGNSKGPLAVVQVAQTRLDEEGNTTTDPPLILPYHSKTPNIQVDAMSAITFSGIHFSGDWFVGKRFVTSGRRYNGIGVEMDNDGIRGYSAGDFQSRTGTLEFEIRSSDGRGYFAGGVGVLDSQGLQINSTTNDGNYIRMAFNGTDRGYISMHYDGVSDYTFKFTGANADVEIGSSTGKIEIIASGGNVNLSGATINLQSTTYIAADLYPNGSWSLGSAGSPFSTVHAGSGYFSTLYTANGSVQYVKANGTVSFTGTVAGISPTGAAHLATKGYVDSVAGGGVSWLEPVKDQINFTTSEPGSPSVGDRYINTATGLSSVTSQSVTEDYIYEWNSSSWTETAVSGDETVYDESDSKTYYYDGADWIVIISSADHGALTGLADDDHPQYISADGSRALTSNWDVGAYQVRGLTFYSDEPTAAPFIVASDTLVSNLNVDKLDNQQGSYYLDLDNTTGTLPISKGGTGVSLSDPDTDSIVYWDDSAGTMEFITISTGLVVGIGTPDTLSVRSASITQTGIIEIATNTEAGAGVATDKALVPSNLDSVSSMSSLGTVGTISTGIWTATTIAYNRGGTGLTSIGNLSLLASNATGTAWVLMSTPSDDTILKYTTVSGFEWSSTLPSHTHDASTDLTGILAEAHGGTDQSTYATGDMLYSNATNQLSRLTIGTVGDFLSVAGGAPTWLARSNFLHGDLGSVDSNQHIDHTSVSISTGTGLSGGGTIAATRTLSIDTGVVLDKTTNQSGISGTKTFTDATKLYFGTSADLSINHTGSINTFISENSYPIHFYNVGLEYMVTMTPNGAVSLYHDGALKLSTASSGINVTGIMAATSNVTVGGTSVSLSGHVHSTGDITSGTLAAVRGGTNADLSGSTTDAIFRWSGTAFTQLSSISGDILVADGSNSWSVLNEGSLGDVLTVTVSGLDWIAGGGGGSTTWTGLIDTPGSFTVKKMTKVNSLGTALEYTSFDYDDVILNDGSVTMSGNFKPTLTDTYDLGNGSNRWLNVHINNNLYLYDTNEYIYSDGGGILFAIDGSIKLHMGSTATYPEINHGIDLGTSAKYFDFIYGRYITSEVLTSKPSPSATYAGTICVTNAGGSAKSFIWMCAENSSDNYEWIHIGTST
jgi:hypothetical protein